MGNIFKRELKYNLKTFILWSVCVSIFMFLLISLYKSMSGQIISYAGIIDSMPKAFVKTFFLDKLSMSDILGFYGTEASLIYLLSGAVFAVLLGSNALSREHSDGTFEFLLSRPVSRSAVVFSKFFACLLYIILFNVVVTFVSYAGMAWYNNAEFSLKAFTLFSVAVTLACIQFLAIGFFFSSIVIRPKSAMSLSLGILFIMYFISIVAQLKEDLKILKYLSPFVYASAGDIISTEKIEIINILLPIAISLVLIVLTNLIYSKKNIT